MKISEKALDEIYPEVERVIGLVVGAFDGKAISNGAIVMGLGAVIGLTLNERMPGKENLEAPDIKEILYFIEAGMEFGRTMEIGRMQ